jgi:hypothetical protein
MKRYFTALLLSLSLLIAGKARSATVDPVRPTFAELSPAIGGTAAYQSFRGHTANQIERDAMEETRLGLVIPAVMTYARTMPSCLNAVGASLGYISRTTNTLAPVYEHKNSTYFIRVGGNHYNFEYYALVGIRNCSLAAPVRCASNPLMTSDIQAVLDLHVTKGKCVAGPERPAQAQEPYDSVAASQPILQLRVRQPTLTSEQTELLHATHAAHKAVSDWRCGVGPEPAAGIVQDAHLAFEASARTTTEAHFFRMKDFSGAVDPDWAPDDVCTIARLQDAAHLRWMDAVLAGNWDLARAADTDHQNAHLCMNIGTSPRLTVRFTCDSSISDCPIQTCAEAVSAYARTIAQ